MSDTNRIPALMDVEEVRAKMAAAPVAQTKTATKAKANGGTAASPELVEIGTNATAIKQGDVLLIAINTKKAAGPSKSGNSVLVSTTHGFKNISLFPGLRVSLNAITD